MCWNRFASFKVRSKRMPTLPRRTFKVRLRVFDATALYQKITRASRARKNPVQQNPKKDLTHRDATKTPPMDHPRLLLQARHLPVQESHQENASRISAACQRLHGKCSNTRKSTITTSPQSKASRTAGRRPRLSWSIASRRASRTPNRARAGG